MGFFLPNLDGIKGQQPPPSGHLEQMATWSQMQPIRGRSGDDPTNISSPSSHDRPWQPTQIASIDPRLPDLRSASDRWRNSSLSTTVCKPQLQLDPNISPVRRDEPELKFWTAMDGFRSHDIGRHRGANRTQLQI
ncbi:hypothetical protein ACLOJK_015000 [Asimina triloba]